ncbi:MAG: phosphotransferase family protein [Chloroflexales bacterium]|nr:phosphotransferase family protein [Chloroflexales bacterium]
MTDTIALQTALQQAIADAAGGAVEIGALQLVAGGASQETWLLDAVIADGAHAGTYRLVLRRPLGGKIYAAALDLSEEFAVLSAAFAAGAPAPQPLWFFPDLLDRPALLMTRLDGETIGRKIVKDPGLATARARLPQHMGQALATIHSIDYAMHPDLATLPKPPSGQTPAQASIVQLETDLDQLGEPHPALEVALRWLRLHEPPPVESVLIHGDFRIGNMVVNPDGLVGVLDWEFAHLGDPAEDLAWPLTRDWRFGVDHLHFGGVDQADAFLAAYAAASGHQVDPARVAYWEIMSNVKWAIGALNQAQRHLSGAEHNLEFASLGRRCAEMELEALALIQAWEQSG